MSRQSVLPARNLSLTEELERLEQSITLTLQEIDSNFSRAHRIVTSSILPLVEDYARHSDGVWEGSKFWKSFFEASANVSLSSYEEPPPGDGDEGEEEEVTVTTEGQGYETPERSTVADDTATPGNESGVDELTDSSLLDSPESRQAQRKQGQTGTRPAAGRRPAAPAPSTPLAASTLHTQITDSSPPGEPPSTARPLYKRDKDALLHRVLDKNYRVQATPHRQAAGKPAAAAAAPARYDLDSSPLSSPAEAPQLRSEIFGTPATAARRARSRGLGAGGVASTTAGGKPRALVHERTPPAARTPGVSVQRASRLPVAAGRTPPASAARAAQQQSPLGAKTPPATGKYWSDEEDDEDDDTALAGMSPPKTLQFHIPGAAHPNGRLLQTPAREAGRRMVEDLLMSAGAGHGPGGGEYDDDDELDDELDDSLDGFGRGRVSGLDPDSPSVVRVVRPGANGTGF